jgi:hypothetical protein
LEKKVSAFRRHSAGLGVLGEGRSSLPLRGEKKGLVFSRPQIIGGKL